MTGGLGTGFLGRDRPRSLAVKAAPEPPIMPRRRADADKHTPLGSMFKHKHDSYGDNGLPLQPQTGDASITEPASGGAFSSLAARLTTELQPAPADDDNDDDGCFYDVAGLDPLTECSDEQLQDDPAGALRAAARDLEAFAAAAERFQQAGWEVCVELDDDDEWQLAVSAPEAMSDEDALEQERLLAGPLAERFDEFAPADEYDEDQ